MEIAPKSIKFNRRIVFFRAQARNFEFDIQQTTGSAGL